MDTPALTAFVAIAETGSFSRAAEQLFITQPAISKRLASLEDELSEKLFDRIGRQIKLTPAGELLLPYARRILNEIQQSKVAISGLGSEVAGKLSIGTSHHIGLHHLPPVLRDFSQHYSNVELDLHFMDSEDACVEVEKGELELAVVTLPESIPQKLQTQLIWPDPMGIAVAKTHSLARHSSISIATLLAFPAILPAQTTITRKILNQAFAQHQHLIKVSLETNYLETIKMMVSVGLGWSLLPKTMIHDEIVPIQITGMILSRNLGLVKLQKRTLSNAGHAFIKTLEKYGTHH